MCRCRSSVDRLSIDQCRMLSPRPTSPQQTCPPSQFSLGLIPLHQPREIGISCVAANMSGDVANDVRSHLTSKQLHPQPEWLASFLASARPNTPLPALKKSAEWKLLAADITQSLDKNLSPALPARVTDVTIQEQRLSSPVVVQVLDIEDIGRSRWSQIELIEQQERGEMTRGREIIRLAPDSEDATNQSTEISRGPHKLLVQDAHGTKVYAFELTPITGIGLNMSIGAKLLLRSASVARGLIMLEAGQVEVLGGKVNAWADQWAKDRKEMLKSRLPQATSGTND